MCLAGTKARSFEGKNLKNLHSLVSDLAKVRLALEPYYRYFVVLNIR